MDQKSYKCGEWEFALLLNKWRGQKDEKGYSLADTIHQIAIEDSEKEFRVNFHSAVDLL